MKAYKVTLSVEFDVILEEYRISSPMGYCHLCRETYRKVIGREVTGDVTFILRKIKGKCSGYIYPFRIKGDNLFMHNDGKWEYSKWLGLLGQVLNRKELEDWAGKSMFSIEMEW